MASPSLLELKSRGTVDLQHFTCFPKLPPELRHRIWQFTLLFSPGSQILELGGSFAGIEDELFFTFEESTPEERAIVYEYEPLAVYNPIALRINKESRAVALQFYTKCPQSNLYMNFSTDALFFNPEYRGHFTPPQPLQKEVLIRRMFMDTELKNIQHLILNAKEMLYFTWPGFLSCVASLPNLKTLSLVFDPYYTYEDNEVEIWPQEIRQFINAIPNPAAISAPTPEELEYLKVKVSIIRQPSLTDRLKFYLGMMEQLGEFFRSENVNIPRTQALIPESRHVAHCLPPPTACLGDDGEAVENYEIIEALGESAIKKEESSDSDQEEISDEVRTANELAAYEVAVNGAGDSM